MIIGLVKMVMMMSIAGDHDDDEWGWGWSKLTNIVIQRLRAMITIIAMITIGMTEPK